jgi:hypothetical protein
MTKTKKTVTNTAIRDAIKRKSIQMSQTNICSFCGLTSGVLGKHTKGCLMNPERKNQNGYKACTKCNIEIAGKNYARHIDACEGDVENTIDRILQVYRVEYLNILRGGQKPTAIDRSLGFGNRAVPEVVRNNVEFDLHQRGMNTDWSISPTLRVIKPEVTMVDDIDLRDEVIVTDTADSDAIGAVVDLIVDERTMAEVLNQIINLATYKLATR